MDELRRLVLVQNERRITKGYLIRAYDWLGVSLAALVDVNEGYKVAYGGTERKGGIEVSDLEPKSPPPLRTTFPTSPGSPMRRMKLSLQCTDIPPPRPLPAPEISVSPGGTVRNLIGDEVEVGESAKGKDASFPNGFARDGKMDRGPHYRGAVTPNGFEDITPVTKGEWCFLMVGDGWKEARTAAVETC